MNKKEFDKKYIGDKLVVHCKTEELANEFLTMADKFGYSWWIGGAYKEKSHWNDERENTCYNVYEGMYGSKKFYIEDDYKIVEFNGFKSHNEYKLIINEESKVIVVINEFGNRGVAKCLPSDKFDIGFGVKLAKAKADGDDKLVQELLEESCKKEKKSISDKIFVDVQVNTSNIQNLIDGISNELKKYNNSF